MLETGAVELEFDSEQKPFVIVGIPAFNEEKTIAGIVAQSQSFADQVIVCDDGSTDLTAEIAENSGAIVIRHKKNLGYGASIKSLFKIAVESNADILVTLDGDGQHIPKEIPDVIKPLINCGADIVIGSRFIDTHGTAEMPIYRQIGAKLITKLVNGSSRNGITDAQCGFRAYNRQALEQLNFSEAGMGASVEILLKASKAKLKIYEVPCSCIYDNGDIATSTEHPLAHGMGVVSSIIRLVVEEKPLVFLGIPGLLFLFSGIFFGTWMLELYAEMHRIVTNVALGSITLIFIGFFMLSTAVTLYALGRLSEKISRSGA